MPARVFGVSLLFLLAVATLFAVSFGASHARAGSSLEKAYRQEIQLLQAEKAELLSRIEETGKADRGCIDRLRSEVGDLSEQLITLRLENEDLEDRLGRQEEEVQVGGDRETLLDSILDQATATLLRYGIEVDPGGEDPRPLIARIFEQGCGLAGRIGSLRVEKGSYFGSDGSELKADILWVGQVAAVSLDPGTGGALGPSGADSLKVLNPGALGQARSLVEGGSPPLVSMYLFDPLERGERAAEVKETLWETFLTGGFVMWPILLLAIVALLILLERLLVLRKVHTNVGRLVTKVGEHVSRGRWGKAAEACHEEPGAVARVLGTILRYREQPRSQLEELVNESILAERPTLERFLPALCVIAAVAPLLGLLGTVTGMIGTFHVITEHGTGDPRLLSGGISEALLTTQFGLMVAIPVLLAHALLSGRVDHVMSDMETNALRLLNKMHCEHCDLLKQGTCTGAWNGEKECPNLVRARRQPPDEKPADPAQEPAGGKSA
jgi:biopolymer transport protein ExbB